jgi:hypothetical protein
VAVDFAAPHRRRRTRPVGDRRPTVGGARVTWAKPLDNGSIITGYR